MTPLYSALVVAVLLALALVWEFTGRSRSRSLERVKEIERERVSGGVRGGGKSGHDTDAHGVTGFLGKLGARLSAGSKASALEDMLKAAGLRNRGAMSVYLAARLLAVCGLFLVFTALVAVATGSVGYGVLGGLYGGVAGLFVPRFYLKRKAAIRRDMLGKVLPDMLDLLLVCVEAGLGLNQALLRVAKEIRLRSPEMADELNLVSQEIRVGVPRAQALTNFGVRSRNADIQALCGMLVNSDQFGTSISDALHTQADTLRTTRRQRAEEAAAKTTIKLVVPLVLFIFPALFIVILGPVILRVLATLAGS